MKLYVKEVKRVRNDTINSILIKLLKKHRYSYSLNATYFDKDFTKLEYKAYAYRSFEVILKVLRSYFSNITEKKLAKELEKILIEDKTGCCFLFCNQANKWILHNSGSYWKRNEDYSIDYNGRLKEEDLRNLKGDGEYTLNEILKLMKEK